MEQNTTIRGYMRGPALTLLVLFTIVGLCWWSAPLHELGHDGFAVMKGGYSAGISLSFNIPAPFGQSHARFPLIEKRTDAMKYWYGGGPAVSVALGLLALVLGRLRVVRRSVLSFPLALMVVENLGALAAALLVGGLFQKGLKPVDFYAAGVYSGIGRTAIRAVEIVVGSIGVALVGLWWSRWTIAEGYLPTSTKRQRFWLLICGVWLPSALFCVGWTVSFLHHAGVDVWQFSRQLLETNASLMMKVAAAKGCLFGALLGLPCLAAVAAFSKPGPPRERPLGRVLIASLIIAVLGAGFFEIVRRTYMPPMAPSPERLEAMLTASPDDPDVLRTVAYFLALRTYDGDVSEDEAASQQDRIYELCREAVRLDPGNPGALHDLAQCHRARGDRHYTAGRREEAADEWLAALGLVTQACERDPDEPAYWWTRSKLCRLLGKPADEREALTEYIRAVEASGVFPDSVRTHVHMAEERIKLIDLPNAVAAPLP